LFQASAVAAIAIAVAAAAANRSPAEAPRSDAALKAKIAELRAEVARLREERGVYPKETPSPSSEPQADAIKGREAPLPLDETRVLLRSRQRADQGRGLKRLESLTVREEK